VFLRAFTKLQKASVSFIVSVHPCGSHWTDFHENLVF